MREHEFAVQGVQGEAVDAIAHGEDEDHGAGVHAVACGQQVASWLAHVHDTILCDLINLHNQISRQIVREGVSVTHERKKLQTKELHCWIFIQTLVSELGEAGCGEVLTVGFSQRLVKHSSLGL